jgi:hypothetical protein
MTDTIRVRDAPLSFKSSRPDHYYISYVFCVLLRISWLRKRGGQTRLVLIYPIVQFRAIFYQILDIYDQFSPHYVHHIISISRTISMVMFLCHGLWCMPEISIYKVAVLPTIDRFCRYCVPQVLWGNGPIITSPCVHITFKKKSILLLSFIAHVGTIRLRELNSRMMFILI